jgi:hypothetical protein
MYQNNRIKDHELYETMLHDLFDLISNYWNCFTSITFNFVNTICYTQEYWIFHSNCKKIKVELMHRIIKKSFRQNWSSKQIVYVKRNYCKLSSVIQDRKNELKENASQRKWSRSISLIASIEFASIEFFVTSVFVSISAFTSVSTSIFTSVFVAFLLVAELSNVQSTQQLNVQRISQSFTNYSSTIYENRHYAQKSINYQRINNWSISQRNFVRYDDHQSSCYSKQFNESLTHRQTYDQFELRNFRKKLIDLIKIYKKENKFKNKNDNFDFKIMIFYDKCNVIELFEHAYMQIASIMLEERALNHYYFNRMYAMTFH